MEKNTVLCITGASSGIGAELAKSYAKSDMTLLLIARNSERLQAVAEACENRGALVVQGLIDVTNEGEMREWLQTQDKRHPIDLLFVNAGLSTNQARLKTNSTASSEKLLLDVHLQGMLNTVHPVMQAMQLRQRGQICLMSSMNAFLSIPRGAMYGAVKSALLHYGLALRGQLAPQGIKVNVLCPGWIKTPLTQLNEFRMPCLVSVEKAAQKIKKGVERNKAVLSFPWQIRLATLFCHLLPEYIRTRIVK